MESKRSGPCKYFQLGTCRFGACCMYPHVLNDGGASHQDAHELVEDVSSMSLTQVLNWLQKHIEHAAATNIEVLGGEGSSGFRNLVSLVGRTYLTEAVVTRIVELLTKEEIRSSMMRHKTNRMYEILLGSPFMPQFQAYIQGLCNRMPRQLHACVQLVEEILSRTSDGWKEVPLDTITTEVEKLVRMNEIVGNVATRDPQMNALEADVKRLLEQRAKLKRSRAVSSSNKFPKEDTFWAIPILPTTYEMEVGNAFKRLPINRIGRRYTSVLEYLQTHYKLLREDYIDSFRQGIKELKNHHAERAGDTTQHLNLYVDVHVQPGLRFGREGIQYEVHFQVADGRRIRRDLDKRLMFGSLLCFSEDKFATHFWGVVAGRSLDDLSKGIVNVRLLQDTTSKLRESACCHWFEPSQRFVMVESSSAYFEPYAHVLKSLQREEMCGQLVFTKHLIDLERKVRPPSYLATRPKNGEFCFSSAFPELMTELGRDSFDILSTWPEWKACALDQSQREALKHGLTKELAIIQGPPGTGKTFVGLLLVRILLQNLKKQSNSIMEQRSSLTGHATAQSESSVREDDVRGPILVVSYTNHAIDQFLMGIHEFENNLIRLGGQSKCEVLKSKTLAALVHEQRQSKSIHCSHRRASQEAWAARSAARSRIVNDGKYASLLKMLVDRTALQEVAAPQHIASLLDCKDRGWLDDIHIVQIWLSGAPRDFLQASRRNETVVVNDQTKVTGLIRQNEYDKFDVDTRDDEAILQGMDSADVESITSEFRYELLDEDEDRQETLELNTIAQLILQPENESDHEVTLQQVEDEQTQDGSQGNILQQQDTVLTEEELQQLDLDSFIHVTDVWALPQAYRVRLHKLWLRAIKNDAKEHIDKLAKDYEEACSNSLEVEKEIQLSLLRRANVVGMTTTAAARYHDVLLSLKSEIVIVEEAAEVLESHILASVSPHTRHVILIGDHEQLRPHVAVHRLADKKKLDVSMFERLVKSGVEYKSLNVQRRMRPCISRLLKPLYPHLKDHRNVRMYPDVQGVTENVFFLNHKGEESSNGETGTCSKVNKGEARIVVEFCLYLLNQGTYSASDITILCMYTGQVHEIKSLLNPRVEATLPARIVAPGLDASIGEQEEQREASKRLPRVITVDDFQGKESNIILLSLVRSNHLEDKKGRGKIGFLNLSNRVCVAISRARLGLYLFGNAALLSEKSEIWRTVVRRFSQKGLVGSHLSLRCQNHPWKVTRVARALDYAQVRDGGCGRPCTYRIGCGHVCPRRCHPGGHDQIVCRKRCCKKHAACQHRCKATCHKGAACPPCRVPMTRTLSVCRHRKEAACSEHLDQLLCEERCPKQLICGHSCPRMCGQPCLDTCLEQVESRLPCGHIQEHKCHEDLSKVECHRCAAIM